MVLDCFINSNERGVELMKEDNSFKNKDTEGNYLAIGMGLGVAFGIIFDNLALWISLGVLFGLVLNSMQKKKNDKED